MLDELKEVKKKLEYELKNQDGNDQGELILDSNDVSKNNPIFAPVLRRLAAQDVIKRDLIEHEKNYPAEVHKIPGMRRKKEKDENKRFLKSVVRQNLMEKDPIRKFEREHSKLLHKMELYNYDQEGKDDQDDFSFEKSERSEDEEEDSDYDSEYDEENPKPKKKERIQENDPRIYAIHKKYGLSWPHPSELAQIEKKKEIAQAKANGEAIPKGPFKGWTMSNPHWFVEDEERRQASLFDLRRKLAKFTARRNWSFNVKAVFNHWKTYTNEVAIKDRENQQNMEQLRQVIKKQEALEKDKKSKQSESTTAESEGNNDKKEEVERRPENSDSKATKKQLNDEDHDEDIVVPNDYLRNNLIPNCFGVYKPS